jgi:hypothetical protein
MFAGALITMAFGLGMSVCGPLTWLFAAGVFSFLTLMAGFGATIFARGYFGLAEVGKLTQFGMFWVFGMIAASITGLFFSVTVTSVAGASLAMILSYLAVSVPTGHIKQYLTRSWLPVKMPDVTETDTTDSTEPKHTPTTTDAAHEADALEDTSEPTDKE